MTAGSGPAVTIFAVIFLSGVYLSLGYLPALQHLGGFPYAWVSVGFTVVGGVLTLTAWSRECRGTVSQVATLFDNALYAAAIALCAVTTRGNVAIAMAIVHGFVLVFFTGQLCAFSVVLAASVLVPTGTLVAVFQPSLPISFILACGVLGMLVFTVMTADKRRMLRRQEKLEQALGAADRIADESVQAALANTLLTLGHFLHELKNSQTAVSINLQYIDQESDLDAEPAAALQEALQAQAEQETLLRSTIDDLKSRAQPVRARFALLELVRKVTSEFHEIPVGVVDPGFEFELVGNPEHLRVILLNLIRNAEQAGASTVTITVSLQPSGHAVQLSISNDGEPLPEHARRHLFDSFTVSSKPGGSGLGLYLVRRYSELLGGRISIMDPPGRGVTFAVQLPGKLVAQPEARSVEPSEGALLAEGSA